MRAKKLRVLIQSTEDFFDDFKKVWKAASKGKRLEKEDEVLLSFPNFEALSRVLTPARWTLLSAVRAKQPRSVNELAKLLRRAQANVHRDVHALKELGVLELKKVKEPGSKKVCMKPLCNWDRFEIPLVA